MEAREAAPRKLMQRQLCMEADYGTEIKVEGRQSLGKGRARSMGGGLSARPVLAPGRGLPLRLLTRRKEVAWIWAGEAGGEPLLLCQYICDNAL